MAPDLMSRVEERVRTDSRFRDALTQWLDAPEHGAGSYVSTAAQEINSTRRRQAVEELKAGSLTTAEVQRLLGFGTPQAVHRLRSRGRLVGLQSGNATWFPSWQFSDGNIRDDLPRILELLRRFSSDLIAWDRAMRIERDDLNGRSISGAIDHPKWSGTAWDNLAELAG